MLSSVGKLPTTCALELLHVPDQLLRAGSEEPEAGLGVRTLDVAHGSTPFDWLAGVAFQSGVAEDSWDAQQCARRSVRVGLVQKCGLPGTARG